MLDSQVMFIDLRKRLTFVHVIYYAASLCLIDSKRAFNFGQGQPPSSADDRFPGDLLG